MYIENTIFEYNGLRLNDQQSDPKNHFLLLEVSGLSGVEFKENEQERQNDVGVYDYQAYTGRREITFNGEIKGEDEKRILMMENLLRQKFSTNPAAIGESYHLLKWIENGVGKQMSAKVMKLPVFTEKLYIEKRKKFTIVLKAADPRVYSQAEPSGSQDRCYQTGSLHLPTKLACQFTVEMQNKLQLRNQGNYAATPIFIIHGPCVNPEIKNATYGISQKFNITLEEGKYITVDTASSRATGSDGSDVLYTIVGGSKWICFLPGINEIHFLTGDIDPLVSNQTPTSYLEINYRHTWL